MKQLIIVASVLIVLGVAFVLTPSVALTQEVACEQDIVVQANDTLSKIANRVYGDELAFRAIAEATNAKAATDSSYAKIDNLDTLEVGWKLCVPSAADAQAILERVGTAGAGPAAEVAPDVDRVGFPEGYQDTFQIFYEFDRPQNKTARVIYANQAAASVQPGEAFPYGSVLAMEVYSTQKDDEGNVLLDENGRYLRDSLFGVFVMRKEPGFGAKYGVQRNGEWEYMAYRPDGSVLVPPENTQGCAACHVEASEGRDWVFGAERAFGRDVPQPGENEIIVADYQFMPETLTVEVGTEVQWSSHDVVFHTITAADQSFSGALRPNQNFTHTFEEPGVFEYFSAIYPNVKGAIEVVE